MEFRLPDIGEGLTEAEIVRWLVAEGEQVALDQPLVEVETDKAVVEIPSPYAGVVTRHGGAEGDIIQVGEVLVVIGEEEAGPAETPGEATPVVGALADEAEDLTPSPQPASPVAAPVKALPVVRKLAREHGIDLATIDGTGPDGRVTREDVEAAIAATGTREEVETEPVSVEEEPEPVPVAEADDRREAMSRLRRTIAANMSRSWAEIPHVTAFEDVDASRLLEVRQALGRRHGNSIPMEALVIRALIPALESFPEFNATLEGDDLVIHASYHIGMAVDTPDGLLVAVVKDAGTKSVLDLAGEVRRLGEGARARRLTPDELTGQTFTVSNIGAVGGGHGTPIVPYGTTAILSVGRAKEEPVVQEGDLVIAPVMPLSLSYDHRVVDGAQGRRFMAMLMENLEEPALFLAD